MDVDVDVDVDVTFCCVVDMNAHTNESFVVVADVFVDAYLDVYACVTVFMLTSTNPLSTKKDWTITVVGIDVNDDGDAFPEVGDLAMVLMLFQLRH